MHRCIKLLDLSGTDSHPKCSPLTPCIAAYRRRDPVENVIDASRAYTCRTVHHPRRSIRVSCPITSVLIKDFYIYSRRTGDNVLLWAFSERAAPRRRAFVDFTLKIIEARKELGRNTMLVQFLLLISLKSWIF